MLGIVCFGRGKCEVGKKRNKLDKRVLGRPKIGGSHTNLDRNYIGVFPYLVFLYEGKVIDIGMVRESNGNQINSASCQHEKWVPKATRVPFFTPRYQIST